MRTSRSLGTQRSPRISALPDAPSRAVHLGYASYACAHSGVSAAGAIGPSTRPRPNVVAPSSPALDASVARTASAASALQAPGFRGDAQCSAVKQRQVPELRWSVRFCGTLRQAQIASRRLITRRSQVQLLPWLADPLTVRVSLWRNF